MFSVSRLRRQPRLFQSFTGLSVSEFDQLPGEVTPLYKAAVGESKSRSDRKRAVGAGRPFSLALPERLLMCLVYLRLYTSQRLVAFLFDLDQSNVCREINERLLPILLLILPVPLRDAPLRPTAENASPSPKRRRIGTLEELLRLHPEIQEVLVDATEQNVPQPEEKLRRKRAYSGKQHEHTIKTQITATNYRDQGPHPACLRRFAGFPARSSFIGSVWCHAPDTDTRYRRA